MRSWRTSEAGALGRLYAWCVVALRWPIVLGWAAIAAAAVFWMPASTAPADLGGFAPPDSKAIATERASVEAFGFPLLSRTLLVQRNESGLSAAAQQRAVERAAAVAKGTIGDIGPIAAAVPVVNVKDVFSSSEQGTTALTFIFSKPGTSFPDEVEAARAFGQQHVNQPDDHLVGVTGTVPAQVEQSDILYDHLLLLELLTLAVVIGVVALKFRSFIAPLVALVTAALSYFLAVRVTDYVGGLAQQSGAPDELKPLVLALVLGIVTDYAIFYLSSMRTGLEEGLDRLPAARASAAQTGRIVLVAGIAVAGGCAAMLVAKSGFLRAFGPVLSISVLTAVVVSVTLLPALLAIFGRGLFWPARPRRNRRRLVSRAAARVLTVRVVALALGGACVVALGALAVHADRLRLEVAFVAALPTDSEPARAAEAAAAGFAPGVIAPTEVLLQGDGVADRQKLSDLSAELAQQPGVAGVLSPSALPDQAVEGALVTKSGDAARLLLVLDDDPLGASAISDVNHLSGAMPGLLQRAGLDGIRYGVAGDTAVAGELVAATNADLRRIGVAVLVINLLLLMVFLRAVVAPVLLLACSVLALAASLGCLALLFQDRLGGDGVAFYVPFAASVLLLSLGSDYNIYGVGHVWTRARHTTLRQAIAERVPETSGAITAAGITLAASFGMLALVPLRQFRELAFVMGLGVLIDALVVRSVLVPALLTLLGRFSAWPRRLEGTDAREQPLPAPPAVPDDNPPVELAGHRS